MAISVKTDVIEGATYHRDRSGVSRVKVFYIDGLGGSGQPDILVQGVEQSGQVPPYGSPHPSRAGLFVNDIQAIPFPKGSKTSIKVTVTYGEIDGSTGSQWKIRISTSQQQLQSSYDYNNKLMVVNYTTPQGVTAGDETPTNLFSLARAPVLVSGTILEFSSLVDLPTIKLWGAAGNNLNSTQWQGGTPRRWLCRGPQGESQYGIALFQASVTFEYLQIGKESGWDSVEFWEDIRLKRVPRDAQLDYNTNGDNADSGLGWTRCKTQGQADFNALGLPNIFG
jgi:hypothetical protein